MKNYLMVFLALMPLILPVTTSEEVVALKARMGALEAYMEKEVRPIESDKHSGIFFDVLYWQPKTDFTELGGTYKRDPAIHFDTTDDTGVSVNPVSFNWSFGFRAGFVKRFEDRPWDLTAEYVYFNFSGVHTINPGARESVAPNFGSITDDTAFIDHAKASHSIGFQTAGVYLGRSIRQSRFFQIKPQVGVKAAWINQIPQMLYRISGANPNIDQHVDLSEKTTSLGPQILLSARQELHGGWGLYANSGVALLFTRYRGAMSIVNGYPTTGTRQSNKESKHYICMNPFLGIGVEYLRDFSEENKSLACSLGYETQSFINQSYLMETLIQGDTGGLHGALLGRNLAVYGLTAKVKIGF